METTTTRSIWDARRAELNLIDSIAITREEFESKFSKTDEKITFTFGGWDGKSYNGESRVATVYRSSVTEWSGLRFVKVGKGIHYVIEDSSVLEIATGECHKTVGWVADVMRKER